MTFKCFLLYLQLCGLIFTLAKSDESGLKIAYHIVCDDDQLASLSYNLMNGEAEVYPNYLEIEGDTELSHHTRFLKGICANKDFKTQLVGYPLLPSLQHGYVVLELRGARQSPHSLSFSNPVNNISNKLFLGKDISQESSL